MEICQSLATESFSYGWLTDQKSHCLQSIFHEHTFNFDIPSTIALVHADELFYDGHIMPSALTTPSTSIPISPNFISVVDNLQPDIPTDSNPSNNSRHQLHLLDKWRKSSKRIFQKCFAFVKPFCKTVGKSSRLDDLEPKVCKIESWSEASPRTSSAYSVVEWNDVKKIRSKFDLGFTKIKSWNSSPQTSSRISQSRTGNSLDGVESSVHEAILYCKKSIEK